MELLCYKNVKMIVLIFSQIMQDDKNVFKSLHRIPNIVFLISVKAIQFVGVLLPLMFISLEIAVNCMKGSHFTLGGLSNLHQQ